MLDNKGCDDKIGCIGMAAIEINRENFPTEPRVIYVLVAGRLEEVLHEIFPPEAKLIRKKTSFDPFTLEKHEETEEDCINLRVGERHEQPALLWNERGINGVNVGTLSGSLKGIYMSCIRECYIRQDKTGGKWLEVVSDEPGHDDIRNRIMFGLKQEEIT